LHTWKGARSWLLSVRYRGLAKNTHRLVVTCALANLLMARRIYCAGSRILMVLTPRTAVLKDREPTIM
jgi:hypothetical protein